MKEPVTNANKKKNDFLWPVEDEDRLLEMVQKMIDNGDDITKTDEADRTLFFVALTKGYTKVMELLIKNGYSVQDKPNNFATALTFAASFNDLDMARILIRNGVDVNAVGIKAPALFYASGKGHLEMMRLLIENGAELNLTNQFSEETPLIAAVKNNNLEAVNLLLQFGPDIDVEAKGGNALAHAMSAEEKLKEELIEETIEIGDDAQEVTEYYNAYFEAYHKNDDSQQLRKSIKEAIKEICESQDLIIATLIKHGCRIDQSTSEKLIDKIKSNTSEKQKLCYAIIENYNAQENPDEALQKLFGHALLELSKDIALFDLIPKSAESQVLMWSALYVLQQYHNAEHSAPPLELSKQMEDAVLLAMSTERSQTTIGL